MNSFQIIFTSTSGSPLLVSQSSYNNVNQLTNRSGTGPLPVRFQGTVNKYSTVTVTNQVATLLDTGFTFAATVSLPVGTTMVPVMAVDVNGNIASNNYAVTVAGDLGKTYLYDPDGNCTNVSMTDTNISYEWDAQNRLHAINIYITNTATLQRSEFSYDGSDRRSQIIEKVNGTVIGTKRFVWCSSQLCQERDGSDAVTKRFFADGEQIAGDNYYYLRDRLGSVQQMIDSDGYICADYDYDPYGNQTKVQGDLDADFGFAGYYLHAPSGLYLTWYRAYDADSGHWLSRDPIEEEGGLNLYDYVGNNPVNYDDPLGLDAGTYTSVQSFITAGDYQGAKNALQDGIEYGDLSQSAIADLQAKIDKLRPKKDEDQSTKKDQSTQNGQDCPQSSPPSTPTPVPPSETPLPSPPTEDDGAPPPPPLLFTGPSQSQSVPLVYVRGRGWVPAFKLSPSFLNYHPEF